MPEKIPRATAALIAANFIIFLIVEIFFGSSENTEVLIRAGGAYVPAVRSGEWWRLISAMFLHAGIRHLLNNMLLLYVLGQHLEMLLGRIRFVILYLVCGIAANYIAFRWYESRGEMTVAVGASGAVFAVMGALLFIIIKNKGRARGLSLRQMLVMLGFSLYFGFVSAGVSNIAHVSGLIAGFIVCIPLYLIKPIN